MKKLILAIIVIAVILLVAPIVTGKIPESQVHTLVDNVNSNQLQNGNTEVLNYNRGLYSATSEYRYTPPLQYAALLTEGSFDYQCKINHGVVSIKYLCTLTNNEQYTQFINERLNGKDPVSMTGKVSAFGKFTNTFAIDEINAFELLDDDTSVSLADTEFTVTTNKDLSNYDIQGGSERFSLTSGTESMSIDNIELGGDLQKLVGGLFTGDVNLSINHVKLTDTDADSQKSVEIKGFQSKTRAEQSGDSINSATNISVNHMALANAPFKTLSDVDFNFSVNGLNKQALIDYQAYSIKLQQQLLDPESSSDIDPMEMVPIIERMLLKNFSLGFNLNGKLDDNSNSTELNIKLLDSLVMNDAMAMIYAPQETLNKLNITFASQFHNDTVNKDPKLAASVLGSPLFVKASDHYTMSIKLGPEIELNNEKTTVEALQTLIMTSALQQP